MAVERTGERILVPPKPKAPLSDDLRHDLQSQLLKQNKIKPLDRTLREACLADGWQARVEERVLEMLRNGEARNVRQLERQVVAEVLGKRDGDADFLGQSNGNMFTGDAHTEGKGLQVPERAVKAGTEIVRQMLEQTVDVKVEQVEDKEWRDWR